MTRTSLRHTKIRSRSSSFQSSPDDRGSEIVTLWKDYESLQPETGLSTAELMNLLRNRLMTHTSLRHTKKRSSSSSSDTTIYDGSSGRQSTWKDYDYLNRNSGLSKSNLMNLLQNQMITHTSLRHTKKHSSSPSLEHSSNSGGSSLLPLRKEIESLIHDIGLTKAELMNLIRNKLMTHTSLRHTKKRTGSCSFHPKIAH